MANKSEELEDDWLRFATSSFNLGRKDDFLGLGLPVKHMQGYDKLGLISSLRTDEFALRLRSNKSAVGQGKTIDLTECQSLSQHCRPPRRQTHVQEKHQVGVDETQQE